jgi:hypothetical protein
MNRWTILACAVLAAGLGSAGAAKGDEALSDPAERERIAGALVERAEQAMGRDFDPGFRASARARLAQLGLEELKAREERGPSAGLGSLAPAGAPSNAKQGYRSVAPCRIIDTRAAGAGGPLAPGIPRNFLVTGNNLSAQGGSATGCNVPAGEATAVVINFVAANPAGAGNLRAWAYASSQPPPPNASVLNYQPATAIANAIVVPLCDPSSTTCNFDIRVQADASATGLVVDVMGYFSVPRTPIIKVTPTGLIDTPVTGPACQAIDGGIVSIVTTGPGQIELSGMVTVNLVHAPGVTDQMNLGFATSIPSCQFNIEHAQARVHASAPAGDHRLTVPVNKTVQVTGAGLYNYMLVANMESGGTPTNSDYVVVLSTSVRAVFYPNEP